ncbi:hypothetical protein [Litorihabitans aurantiacus]|uniref:hypothetical protein n=1 Tax=Litorihabitans aurantiacus TaxID=1930061 RepID=UPI0024E0D9B8|nr:hypothetical protein [Litorihabitans aurantiacus]
MTETVTAQPTESPTGSADGTTLTMAPVVAPETLPLELGEQLVIRDDSGTTVATMTVNAIDENPTCRPSTDSQIPGFGKYIQVTIGATARAEWDVFTHGPLRVGDGMFAGRVDGRLPFSAISTAYQCFGDEIISLQPGESWAGPIIVDVPNETTSITIRPWRDSEARWEIQIP